MATRLHHLALRASDCEASARFYRQTCGLSEWKRFDEAGEVKAVWLRCGDLVVMIERALRGVGPEKGSGHVLVFPTDDLPTAERALQAQGVEITDRTAATLYFQDPDGHRAGLSTFAFDETGP